MLLTEEQAKEKLCPVMTRGMPIVGNSSQNEFLCRASECIAWHFKDRTHSRETELWSKMLNQRVNSAYGDDAEWRPVTGAKDDPPPPAVGHCGLVGQVS